MAILKNKIKCTLCGDVLESRSVHDFKFCKCKTVAVDGGKDYLKRLFNKSSDYEELSELTDDPENTVVDPPKTTYKPKAHVLCYIDGSFAYFTNLPLNEQTGDDWDDAPYDSNAGLPYGESESQMRILAFRAPWLLQPKDFYPQKYSVDDINAGKWPWLTDMDGISVYAGATMQEFKQAVLAAGGKVFEDIEEPCV